MYTNQRLPIELNESFRFFFATLLSVYNKWMFAPDHLGFPAPLFVTTIHMFIQFILAAILRAVWPKTFRPPYNPSRRDYGFVLLKKFSVLNLSLQFLRKKAIPTALATGLDIGFSNLSLKTITLSFYSTSIFKACNA